MSDKPFKRFRGEASKGSQENKLLQDILEAYRGRPGKTSKGFLSDQKYYDQAVPDLVGDPFKQAKWFEENDIMN